ncbi:DDRGK domain-containing protein 1 [Nilaparvata lugens]|uniref:DDRGK domain-containing protein 1 n=1 Tax=Nilaparvata lugens TaxID=108931 RepID=UPI00193CBB31|nr:DDRGK domain-containing protein 1 [Nilaparvata lugens]
MDLTILLAIASGFILIVLFAILFKHRKGGAPQPEARPQPAGGPRRAVGARNTRARLRAAVGREEEEDEEEAAGPARSAEDLEADGKIGAKKRAKLEAKAERKVMREALEKEREEKKKRQERQDEERRQADEKEKAEEEKRLKEEERIREEKIRKEHEEYLKMKAAFVVEEEGFDETLEDNEGNLLKEFVKYIKENKVVVLEDLAAHFKMKTQTVIDRINDFLAEGILTGVTDDRGKFIYISQEELEKVAKFVKQRGRVSIVELVENSNNLIDLTPRISVST